MDDQQLAEIEARLCGRTPGTWETDEAGNIWAGSKVVAEGTIDTSTPEFRGDAEFIAHAPTDLAALLAEVRRLRTENAALAEVMPSEKVAHAIRRAVVYHLRIRDWEEHATGEWLSRLDAARKAVG